MNNTSSSDLHHDIGRLPGALTYYLNHGLNNSFGSIENLPDNLTRYYNMGYNITSGNIALLPNTLTHYDNAGKNTTFGNIAHLNNSIVYFKNRIIFTFLRTTPTSFGYFTYFFATIYTIFFHVVIIRLTLFIFNPLPSCCTRLNKHQVISVIRLSP